MWIRRLSPSSFALPVSRTAPPAFRPVPPVAPVPPRDERRDEARDDDPAARDAPRGDLYNDLAPTRAPAGDLEQVPPSPAAHSLDVLLRPGDRTLPRS